MAQELVLSAPATEIPLWLLERRKLCKDWGKKLKVLEAKGQQLKDLISDKKELQEISLFIQANEGRMQLAEWLKVEKMLLESSEGKEKGIFGGFSSPLIKECRMLIAMNKKDNLYLAGIGKEVSHRVQFEIPDLRKQILLLDKQAKDEVNKIRDSSKSAEDAHEAYIKECKRIGVLGANLDSEILDLVKEVPDFLQRAASKLIAPEIKTFLSFYQEYIRYQSMDPSIITLQHLKLANQYGDIITPLANIYYKGEKTIPKELLDREAKKYRVYESFSENYLKSLAVDFVVIEDTTEEKTQTAAEQVDLLEETLLSDRDLRVLVINDVMEAQAFIIRRLQELKGAEEATYASYEDVNKPEIIMTQDNIEFLSKVAKLLSEALKILQAKRLFLLLNLKHNPESKDRIKTNLQKHLGWAERYEKEAKFHQAKEEELLQSHSPCLYYLI